MFAGEEQKGGGEQKPAIIRASKGWPEVRDPAAGGSVPSVFDNLSCAAEHQLRIHYGPALVR